MIETALCLWHGAAMLRIEHTDTSSATLVDDPRAPSKQYADALWQSHPRISPDWWREALGHTVGKLALDWRQPAAVLASEYALAEGCNLVVASPDTWSLVAKQIASQPQPDGVISVLMMDDGDLPEKTPHYVIWSPVNLPDATARQQVLSRLETAVQQGHIEAYGIHMPAGGSLPLHTWLDEAATAAAVVWNRKKRSALRWVVVEQDLLNLSHVTHPTTLHREEAVSTLELASRLGLAVLVLPQVLPAAAEPPQAALEALVQVAQTESALNEALGGWPHAGDQPLFSVLAALGQGYTPWPTPYVWQAWRTQVWPHVQATWQALAAQRDDTLMAAYLAALEGLLPYGVALSHAAAQPVLAHVLAGLRPQVPQVWQNEPETTLILGVLTALPAVTAVAVVQVPPLAPLRDAPGLPDVAHVLQGVGSL